MDPLCHQRYCTQSIPCILWESVCEQGCKQILACEVFFLSTALQIPHFDLPDSVAPVKTFVEELSVLSAIICADALETNSIVNDLIVK